MSAIRHLSIWLVAAACGVAAAQDPAAQNPLTALQSKSSLSEDDRTAVRNYLQEQIGQIVGGDPLAATEAVERIREVSTGSEGYREALAAIAVQLIGPAYKQAELLPATQLITVLDLLNAPATAETLLEALRDERVAVRTAAAVGLRDLRKKLALQGAPVVSRVIDALREVGVAEASPAVLGVIYHAMNYVGAVPNPPNPEGNAEQVLRLLDTRAQAYAGGSPAAEGAEYEGLLVISGMLKQLDENEKRELAKSIATMLKYAVMRYTSGDAPLSEVDTRTDSRVQVRLRDQMELLIMKAEDLLKQLLNVQTAPSITAEMKKGRGQRIVTMKIEMNKWAQRLKDAGISGNFSVDERGPAAANADGERDDG